MTHQTFPILYSFRRCPYAMRARLALFVSGQQVRLREVVLRDKPAAMLDASAKATVPVLCLPSGQVIDESLDIMLWALEQADPKGWYQPQVGGLEEMLHLINKCDTEFKPHLDRYKYANRYEDAQPETHRTAAATFLAELEQRLVTSRFLFGHRATLADYAVMPFIRQFAGVDRDWFAAAPYPQLQAWMAGLMDESPFRDVMEKYPQWAEGDTDTLFPAD
ncbi:MAG: glutathione S-transferase [Kordiimonadaceae bacterium]|nr:glutathione S-transferase [Kordiimonadaceae bacterium]